MELEKVKKGDHMYMAKISEHGKVIYNTIKIRSVSVAKNEITTTDGTSGPALFYERTKIDAVREAIARSERMIDKYKNDIKIYKEELRRLQAEESEEETEEKT